MTLCDVTKEYSFFVPNQNNRIEKKRGKDGLLSFLGSSLNGWAKDTQLKQNKQQRD